MIIKTPSRYPFVMRWVFLMFVASTLVLTLWVTIRSRMASTPLPEKKTLAQRLDEYGPAARKHWEPWFVQARIPYPPQHLRLVGLKEERQLLVYAGQSLSQPVLVRSIPILGASGQSGPKLREGDRQVPEGLYAIDALNPNSRHRVSMHINYPNPEDQLHAQEEGRDRPGSDIMIHGSNTSIGCLAVGDEASADLFVLAADSGLANIQVILAPCDLRQRAAPNSEIPWVPALYARIRAELEKLPQP
jgi:hypothetical protein